MLPHFRSTLTFNLFFQIFMPINYKLTMIIFTMKTSILCFHAFEQNITHCFATILLILFIALSWLFVKSPQFFTIHPRNNVFTPTTNCVIDHSTWLRWCKHEIASAMIQETRSLPSSVSHALLSLSFTFFANSFFKLSTPGHAATCSHDSTWWHLGHLLDNVPLLITWFLSPW